MREYPLQSFPETKKELHCLGILVIVPVLYLLLLLLPNSSGLRSVCLFSHGHARGRYCGACWNLTIAIAIDAMKS